MLTDKENAMRDTMRTMGVAAAGSTILLGCAGMGAAPPGPQNMTFFVTSVGPGKGGDLGGLAGADRHCAALAKAAGGPDRTWRAYLSTQATGPLTDMNFVNARDRIGTGPWQNVRGVVVATSVDNLHSASNNINKQTALDERGNSVNARGETPLKHDMLTGSRPDGTAFPGPPFPDMTCGSWTKGTKEGAAMTGHHDAAGPIASGWAISWNSSHPTLGCDQASIRPTGGDGLFYCFAAN
jgi:hypothetical protein